MPKYFIRSTIFNLCFFVLTGVACVLLLPTLLFPRNIYLAVVHGFVKTTAFLEKYILGLTYEIKGLEHLPTDGSSYIVAAKHQSAYETLKLHILFKDPAIVLKQELLKIPLWGKYLQKSDVIAIDRSTPKAAIKSIQDGARHVKSQNRPIIIFPQGTRVSTKTTTQEKPYKIGIIRIQEATDLPIIPMALNTGVFHPKHSWIKKPGVVTFQFLPPIPPSDKDQSERLKEIEMSVEEKTARLIEQGEESLKQRRKKSPVKWAAIAVFSLCTLYTINWFVAAHLVKNGVNNFIAELKTNPSITKINITPAIISGFPGKLHLDIGASSIQSKRDIIAINSFSANSWPFLGTPIQINMKDIKIRTNELSQEATFENLTAEIINTKELLKIISSELNYKETTVNIAGNIKKPIGDDPNPNIDLNLDITNIEAVIQELITRGIIKQKHAMFANVALQAFKQGDTVKTTITNDGPWLYLGPIRTIKMSQ